MKQIAAFVLLMFALVLPAFAQNTAPQADNTAQPATNKDDISGMYSFLKDGEFVQINQEPDGYITGFVSRFGDDATDKKTFLDQFFSKASLNGTALTFATKAIHGTWFEFAGTVQRGSGKTPGDEGYRLIKGKLTRHKTDVNGKESAESREIEMNSFPAEMDED
jgi:hypothetical protein